MSPQECRQETTRILAGNIRKLFQSVEETKLMDKEMSDAPVLTAAAPHTPQPLGRKVKVDSLLGLEFIKFFPGHGYFKGKVTEKCGEVIKGISYSSHSYALASVRHI